MHIVSLSKRGWLMALLAVAIALAAALPTRAAPPPVPNAMAALGDSITRAFNTGFFPFFDAPQNSWSTGTSSAVNSLYVRFRVQNPNITGRNYNYAVSGAKMADLNAQAQRVSNTIEYVTILIGANDVCTSSETTMTSVAAFETQFRTAMLTLKNRAPNARLYVLSIPNAYRLWYLFRNNSSARFTWWLYRICPSMLKNPTSTAAADVARRAQVQQRIHDFNAVLQAVCTQDPTFAAHCRYDGGAVFNEPFDVVDVSTRDYFHPSLAGLARLARVAWGASGFAP